MLIDYSCCLGAPIAVCAAEIEGGDAMLAEVALERGTTVQWFGCVISHIFIVDLLAATMSDKGCATLE